MFFFLYFSKFKYFCVFSFKEKFVLDIV